MMRNKTLILSLAGLTALAGSADVLAQAPKQAGATHFIATPPAALKYASERSARKFAGASRVVLDRFDPLDTEAASAWLQLDNNDVIFSALGERRVTVVFYKPFEVKLTRLDGTDPDDRDGRTFAVEIPKEYAAALGGSSLRLVAPVGDLSQPRGVRLLLLNLKGRVTDALELWPMENPSEIVRSPSSHVPAMQIQRRLSP